MSSSLPEPENAASNGQVKPINGSNISRDGDQHKTTATTTTTTTRRTPPPRAKSTSLLTQGLETAYEVDEHTPTATTYSSSFLTPTRISREDIPTPPHNDVCRNNGLKRTLGDGAEDTADTMAVVASASDLQAGGGLGGAPILTSTDINFNTLFTNHHESLVKNRGRGTSLERTEKEKRIQELPKGIYNTNPGDTGMTRAVTPSSPTSSAAISTAHPTEGPRAQYRSWRDGREVRAGTAAEKAWSIGGTGNDDGHGGQVEKSIAEALAGVEPNSRSRKSSHSLRFFKEGLPDDQKIRDPKNRGRSKESRHQTGEVGSLALPSPKDVANGQQLYRSTDRESSMQSPMLVEKPPTLHRHTSLNPTEGLVAETNYFDISTDIETVSEEQLKEMPPDLLADIRKAHNLTPGGAKGSSFSSSIPVTESERVKPKTPSDELVHLLFDSENSEPGHVDASQVKSADEEEDSGEEQIASALFVPHKTPHESPDRARGGFDDTLQPTPHDQHKYQKHASPEWLEEHEVPSSKEPEIKVDRHTQNQRATSHRDEPRRTDDVSVKPPQRAYKVESEDYTSVESILASNTSNSGYDDVTCTGSLNNTSTLEDIYRQPPPPPPLPSPQDEPKANHALDAIELIPYRHQVGGHTTMWRFSKRAVCKQLNNGENMFYEKVEHYHPRLLPFLPRYAPFSSLPSLTQAFKLSLEQDPKNPTSSLKKLKMLMK